MRQLFCLILILLYSEASSQCTGNDCSICDITVQITGTSATEITSTSTIATTITPGNEATGNPLQIQAVDCGTISLELDIMFDWQQGVNINWIHGVSFDASAGWASAAGVVPANWQF